MNCGFIKRIFQEYFFHSTQLYLLICMDEMDDGWIETPKCVNDIECSNTITISMSVDNKWDKFSQLKMMCHHKKLMRFSLHRLTKSSSGCLLVIRYNKKIIFEI